MPDINAPALLKSRNIYIAFALFLGLLGIHNFYAGRYKTAVAQALLCGRSTIKRTIRT